MKIIVAVDKNWGIGCENDLLFSLPLDMKHFKETTLNSTVVMGRKTLESLPGGKPLKNRENIVLSSQNLDGDFKVVGSVDELLKTIGEIGGGCQNKETFVIGGGSVYALLLDYCDGAIITKIDSQSKADTFFPNLDEHKDWVLDSEGEWINDGDYKIKFCKYRRK